jgi:hypothetical protein
MLRSNDFFHDVATMSEIEKQTVRGDSQTRAASKMSIGVGMIEEGNYVNVTLTGGRMTDFTDPTDCRMHKSAHGQYAYRNNRHHNHGHTEQDRPHALLQSIRTKANQAGRAGPEHGNTVNTARRYLT